MKTLTFLLLCNLFALTAFSQTGYFYKSTGELELTKAIIPASDCSYAVMTQNAYMQDVCVARYDCNDQLLWKSCFDIDTNYIFLWNWIQVGDGGYIGSFTPTIGNSGNGTTCFIKIDQNGNFQWCKSYAAGYSSNMQGLCAASNNTFFAAGRGCLGGNSVVKFDASDCDIIWQRNYNTDAYFNTTIITRLSDGNYALSGFSTTNASNSSFPMSLFKINEAGLALWGHTYYMPGDGLQENLVELSNSEIIITNTYTGLGVNTRKIGVIHAAADGTRMSSYYINHADLPDNQLYNSGLSQLTNGDVVIGGNFIQDNTGEQDAILVRLNPETNTVISTLQYGNYTNNAAGFDESYELEKDPEGNIMVGGYLDGTTLLKLPPDLHGLCDAAAANFTVTALNVTDNEYDLSASVISYSMSDFEVNFYDTTSVETNYCVSLGVTESTESMFKLWPNPVQNTLYLETANGEFPSSSVKIYSLNGELIGTFDLLNGSVDCSKLDSGIYLIGVKNGDETETTLRFVKS